jgi:BirA family biotin operon repressor/biotin-[acetyl-CoA-carboxylase] ligase
MELAAGAAAAGVGLIACDTVGSTNAEALRYARAGERGPLWITARAQTAGRGRRGRDWVSEPGNLYATLLLTDPAPPERAPQLSFVAALAVHDAVSALAPALVPRLQLKWPNDVLADGAKLAGILIEAEGASPLVAVVGIGVNCRHHPEGLDYPATDLAALGAAVGAADLFEALSGAMLKRLREWGEGFGSIRAEWLKRTARPGADIRVRLGTRDVSGRFETLDEAGHLMLRRPDGGIEAITAGEVFHLSSDLGPAAAGGA